MSASSALILAPVNLNTQICPLLCPVINCQPSVRWRSHHISYIRASIPLLLSLTSCHTMSFLRKVRSLPILTKIVTHFSRRPRALIPEIQLPDVEEDESPPPPPPTPVMSPQEQNEFLVTMVDELILECREGPMRLRWDDQGRHVHSREGGVLYIRRDEHGQRIYTREDFL